MADWIKIPGQLRTAPQVQQLCRLLNLASPQEAVGYLVDLLGYFAGHSEDGRFPHWSAHDLDTLLQKDGFAAALEKVGWLRFLETGGVELLSFGSGPENRAKELARLRQKRYRARHGSGAKNQPTSTKPAEESAGELLTEPATEEHKKAEPKKVRNPRPTPNSPHHRAIAFFSEAWGAKYGTKYPFAGGKDATAVKAILLACEGREDEFQRVVTRYLADTDSFIVKSRHTLSLLRSGLARWVVPAPSDPRDVFTPPVFFGSQPSLEEIRAKERAVL